MRLPARLNGNHELVPWLNSLRDAIASLEIRPGIGYKVRQSSDGTILEVAARGVASGGWDWEYPDHKELDPRYAYTVGGVAAISPGNDLVATGLTDRDTNTTLTASPGLWLCVKDVAAKGVDNKYNVPHTPYPGATGTPAGTPLKGDYDGANVYWVLLSAYPECI